MLGKLNGVPVEQLTFVRVVSGLDGFTAGNDGSLNTSLHSTSLHSGRLTTHGTLNGVVSDHVFGTFSHSKFAVIGNLLQMCDKNDLVSIQPADTFFWSESGTVQVPDAILFAPKDEILPVQIEENVRVIRYDANADGKTTFENLKYAITDHFDKNNIPYFGISMNGWVKNTWIHNIADNTKQIANEFSKMFGHEVLNDLHANTLYSYAENTYRDLKQFSNVESTLKTKEQYEEFNRTNIAQGGHTFIQEVSDSVLRMQNDLKELPEVHRLVYMNMLEPFATSLKQSLNNKLDQWYPSEEPVYPTPPPLPPELNSTSPIVSMPTNLPVPDSEASRFIHAYLRSIPTENFPLELLQEKATISDLRADAEKSIYELNSLLAAKGMMREVNLNEISQLNEEKNPLILNAMCDSKISRVFERAIDEMELFSEAFACHASDVGDYLSEAAARDGLRSDVNELYPFKEKLQSEFNNTLCFINAHGIPAEEAALQVSRTLASAEPGLIHRTKHSESSFVI